MSSGFTLAFNFDQIAENEIKLVKLNSISMVIIRRNNEIFALNSRCPHMGCSFGNGALKEYILTCPCHGWSFDIRNGQYQANKNIKLETFETKVENGQILVKAVSEYW
jgi:nitrite reductase/ring-hydroxylating ferredoxin subunit